MNRIITRYDDWCRMGNRMFVYAFGKILARKTGRKFYCEPLGNFLPNDDDHNIKELIGTKLNNPLYLRRTYGDHYVDYEQVLTHDGDIIVDSFLQKASYYTDHLEDIKKWFSKLVLSDKPSIIPQPDVNGIVFHIRETDYKTLGFYLDETYYNDIIDKERKIELTDWKEVSIVTDNCTSSNLETYKQKGCRVISQQAVTTFNPQSDTPALLDFIYMLTAPVLVMSQSSFCWWAAFLGDHKRVYFPVSTQKGMWKSEPHQNDIDLYLPNFIKVIL